MPAYITGLSLGVKTAPSNLTLMVYDPRDSQDGSGLDGWGEDGKDSLKSIYGVTIGQERGVEAFYNAAVVPWFRVALDLQYIRPGVRGNDDAFFAGLSAQVKL